MTFVRRYGIPILGIVLLVAGFVLVNVAPATSFGWTAYAPLTRTTFVPSVGFWFEFAPKLGVAALVSGFALVSGWIGYGVGRRSKSARKDG